MNNMLCVKGRIIGKGKPLICVPIMAEQKDEIVAQAKRLADSHVDMIEWRVDAFAKVESLNAIREVLEALAPIVADTILVYTFRSKNQGGLLALDQEQIRDIRQVAAESGVVDFIDVEVFESKRSQREIAQLQEMGAYVIGSHHDFAQTPQRNVIRMILEQIHESGADIVKLALMPQQMQDVLDLLEETYAFHEEHPDKPLVTMSMGAMGCISRVSGEFFGSCITFGAGEVASAPGQLPAEALDQTLQVLHESIVRE